MCWCVIIIINFSIIRVLYKLDGFLIFFFIWAYSSHAFLFSLLLISSLSYLLLYIPVQFGLIYPFLPHLWQAEFLWQLSLLRSVLYFFVLLQEKETDIRWWYSCIWIPFLIFIYQLVCIDHVLRWIVVTLGVIIF